MRKIIAPVDFSENSWNALKAAIQYFKYEKCIFYLLHTYGEEVYANEEVTSRALLEEHKQIHHDRADGALDEILTKIKAYYPAPNHSYEKLPVFGYLLDEIHDLVEKENIDLIVMGTKGKSDNKQLTYGSQTLQVIKYVKCPVLAIPAVYSYERPSNILFPTNYMLPYRKRELKLLSCLAKSYRATIHMLYLSNYERLSLRQEDNKALLSYSFRENSLQSVRQDYGPIVEKVNAYIKAEGIEMIVMVNTHHSYMEELLDQSNLDPICLHTEIPLLVLQNLAR
ncbi:MAG: universal stress protein [Cytophagaceae bacterium]|nr:universal stress protein [Cytophagaceae bacterium]